jgi:aminopeptidase
MTQASTALEARTQAENLDLLAHVAVNVGLGLKPGQELVMTASLDSVALARRITEHAYRAGASLVTALLNDEDSALLRYRYAPDASFDHAAKWLYDGMAAAFKSGAARLAIAGANPALLSNEDPTRWGALIAPSRKPTDPPSN